MRSALSNCSFVHALIAIGFFLAEHAVATDTPQFKLDESLKDVPVETLEEAYKGKTPPEGIRMYLAIVKGSRMGAGEGWFGNASSNYGFDWLASKAGIKSNEAITKEQLPIAAKLFNRLDRNKNGRIESSDLDWSERNSWVQHAYVVNRLFRKLDPSGDGQLTKAEWDAFFEKAAAGKEAISYPDLREAWLKGMSDNFLPGDAPTKEILLKGLFAGEVGSMQEGPNVGDTAPDFSLQTVDGHQKITLSKQVGQKPIVLVFGNFTCGPFRSMYPEVDQIAQRFKDEAIFYAVYVREAHPTDGWNMQSNESVGVSTSQPKTLAERTAVAGRCQQLLKPSIPLLVDTLDDATGHAYSGMPARLYVIDRQGKVAYKGGRGPFGFKAGEMEQALVMTLLDEAPEVSALPAKGEAAAVQSLVDAAQRSVEPAVSYAEPRQTLLSNDAAWKLLPSASVGHGAPLPGWARALARSLPFTAAAVLELDYAYRTHEGLSQFAQGLIRLGVARELQSEYGQVQALAILKRAGMADQLAEQLAANDFSGLTTTQQLLLGCATQLTRAGRDLTDQQVAAMHETFGADRLVGIVLYVAYANFQDRLVHAFGLPVDETTSQPPIAIEFANSTAAGLAATPAVRKPPAIPQPVKIAARPWSTLSYNDLQQRLSAQRQRTSRIAIPTWEEFCQRFPKGLYNPEKPLEIRWSRLVCGRQPQLGPAWIKCLRVFEKEAHQNRVFEESMFWIVTRELQCNYCMGHCEMLMQVGGLTAPEIAIRTKHLASGDWSHFTMPEQGAFALASQLTTAPAQVTDEQLKIVRESLGEAATDDALWWIARCQFMTKVSDAFQLPLEETNVFANFMPPAEGK